MNITIIKLSDYTQDRSNIENSIKEIFFLSSSKKNFNDENHKQEFFKKWCGDYLAYYPQWVYLLMVDDELYGYLTGTINSLETQKKFKVPGLDVFSDLYQDYSAHLHINFHPKARGLGLGSKLIMHFLNEISSLTTGCHLITSPGERNISFYKRLGFVDEFCREKNGYPLLFLGRKNNP